MDPLERTRTVAQVSRARSGGEDRLYLLVIEGGSSSAVAVPPTGVMTIGRAPEADIRVADDSVSRLHARLIAAGGEVRIVDLASHNGVAVNGERISEATILASGDVIALGQVTLVAHVARSERSERAFIGAGELQELIAGEVERSNHSGRSFAVVSAGFRGAPGDAAAIERAVTPCLRSIDRAAWISTAQLAAVAPELVEDEAALLAQKLLDALRGAAPELEARAGYAIGPADGADPHTLLSAARAAAGSAPAQKIGDPDDAILEVELGAETLTIADPSMIHVFRLVERLAASDLPVLVLGETGAGKELIALALHHRSKRAAGPLISVNCAALPETLIESELFGHQRGAFTGAIDDKPGLLERGSGGTVFLDELGELSLGAQAKLLRALETRRITRLGDDVERQLDVRVIAATNRDLEAEIAAGRFRKDLYFRLGAARVVVPPLRDRRREIPVLARKFLERACEKAGRATPAISAAVLVRLGLYHWPGNIRELINTIEYCAATAQGPILDVEHLPQHLRPAAGEEAASEPAGDDPHPPRLRPLYAEVAELERARILAALEAAGGVQKHAAELISVPRRTFLAKLKVYGITGRAR